MGQKVNPKIFRIGVINTWDSKWFSKKQYALFLEQDIKIRRFLEKKLKEAGVAKIIIERSANAINITIHAARPGLIIGRGGVGIEELKQTLKDKFIGRMIPITVNLSIMEVENTVLSATLVVQNIAADLEKRIPFRRVIKQTIGKIERAGCQGVKIQVAGRLNGAEIARTERLSSGKIPLHTLRADVDYSRGAARTTYGAIGIKVWIYKGEIFKKGNEKVAVK